MTRVLSATRLFSVFLLALLWPREISSAPAESSINRQRNLEHVDKVLKFKRNLINQADFGNNYKSSSSDNSNINTNTTYSQDVPNKNEETRRQQQALKDDEYLIGMGLGDITGPAADINLVSLIAQITSTILRQASLPSSIGSSTSSTSATSNVPYSPGTLNNFRLFNNLLVVEHPSWRELSDIKLRFRINLNSFLNFFNDRVARWAMPNQIKIQAEYTYANLVVQL